MIAMFILGFSRPAPSTMIVRMTDQAIRYSRTAMLLHWAIALALVFNFALGERTEHLKRGAELFWVMQLHKSVGITILLLSLWRLGLRFFTRRPAKAQDSDIAQFLSSAVHWGFYAVMILVPLSGWALVSTARVQLPTLLFGTIPWPHLPVQGRDVHEVAEELHEIVAKLMIPLLALHLVGAVRHQFMLKDALVERMVPVRRVGVLGMVLLVASLAVAFVAGKNWPAPAAAEPGETLPDFQQAKQDAPAAAVPALADAAQNTQVAAVEEEEEASRVAPAWKVTPGGRLGFKVTVNGEAVSGSFGKWDAAIAFDPDQLDKSSIRATISLASVNSGDAGRDDMLHGDDFFGAAHPTARFTADRIRAKGGNRYEARGALQIKGVSKPVALAFSLDIKGKDARANGTATFDRRDFGVGTGQFAGTDTVSGNVTVDFAFRAKMVARDG
jgi:cytochrome b561/polyisoprenoid-binding protein YceI